MAAGGAAAAAADAAIAQATKASGVIVRVEAGEFLRIIERAGNPLVVTCQGGIISTNYQYLTSYKGLAFYTKSHEALMLPPGAEVITAETIWIPS